MLVSEEWRAYADEIRRIVSGLKKRPTHNIEEQIENLITVADELEREASFYAAEEEQSV